MIPLIITARLRNGFAASDPWSPALDGILGYWMMRERLGEAQFTADAAGQASLQTVTDLPLARIEHDGLWWWACSSPIYAEAAQALRYYHRRFDAQAAERHAQLRGRVQTKAGPYKAARLSQIVHVCPAVTWHAVGDADEVRRLLSRCSAIGAKIGAGFGAVAEWTVDAGGDGVLAMRHRPVPADYAEAHTIDGQRMWWGLRPPVRLAENQALCVMPEV